AVQVCGAEVDRPGDEHAADEERQRGAANHQQAVAVRLLLFFLAVAVVRIVAVPRRWRWRPRRAGARPHARRRAGWLAVGRLLAAARHRHTHRRTDRLIGQRDGFAQPDEVAVIKLLRSRDALPVDERAVRATQVLNGVAVPRPDEAGVVTGDL